MKRDATEARKEIPPDILRRLLVCDAVEGRLYWRVREPEMFSTRRSWRTWNKRYGEKEAFTANARGYRSGQIFNRVFLAHRVIWAMTNGWWPEAIDHVDGCKSNNSISNLRAVSHAENMKNLPRAANNSSGATGVSWNKKMNAWTASIQVDSRLMHIGAFSSFDAAVQARRSAEKHHGFSEHHGRS